MRAPSRPWLGTEPETSINELYPLGELLPAAGAFLAVLVAGDLEENIRGKVALHSYVSQLRAQGERLTLAELDLPQSPTGGGHGVTELLALTNQFNALRQDCPFPVDSLPRLRRSPTPPMYL